MCCADLQGRLDLLEAEKQAAVKKAEDDASEQISHTKTEAEKRISAIVSMLSVKETELTELRTASDADAAKITLLQVRQLAYWCLLRSCSQTSNALWCLVIQISLIVNLFCSVLFAIRHGRPLYLSVHVHSI